MITCLGTVGVWVSVMGRGWAQGSLPSPQLMASVQGLGLPDTGHWNRGSLGGQEGRRRDGLCPPPRSVWTRGHQEAAQVGTEWPVGGYDHCHFQREGFAAGTTEANDPRVTSPSQFFKFNFY